MDQRIFRVCPVTRPNAGGKLFAPVDQHGVEHGITPSYDGAAMQRMCTKLNAPKASKLRNGPGQNVTHVRDQK